MVKRFLSAVQDDYRPAYGRHRVTYPRQCIFTGTTNEKCYLKDPTGGRRFWPVTVTKKCDIAKLTEERSQLWAEAVARFKAGEAWHLSAELEIKAAEEQADRIEPDDWSAPIMEYLNACPQITFITTGNLLEDVLRIEKKDWVVMAQRRVASILRVHGWKQTKRRVSGVQTKGFSRPTPPPNDPGTSPKQPAPEGTPTGKPGTDDTHKKCKGNTENSSKINAGTHGTHGTDTFVRGGYMDCQKTLPKWQYLPWLPQKKRRMRRIGL